MCTSDEIELINCGCGAASHLVSARTDFPKPTCSNRQHSPSTFFFWRRFFNISTRPRPEYLLMDSSRTRFCGGVLTSAGLLREP